MLGLVAPVRTGVSEERIAFIIMVSDNYNVLRLLVTDNVVPSSPILVTLMMEAIHPPKRRFFQDPHGVTSVYFTESITDEG
jgi:hypothetical protein